MHDRTTKGLLFLIFLALVFNAVVMLVRPAGRYSIASRAYGGLTEEGYARGHHGCYTIDTVMGELKRGN